MEKYPRDEKIAIGDSVTDLKYVVAITNAARDRLACVSRGTFKTVYSLDFIEMRQYLEEKWK